MQKKITVPLLRKKNIARDTWLFAFEKPQEYNFLAGQYQTLFLPLPNGQRDSRDITIASSPMNAELWAVTKIEENHSQFKDVLQNLVIGSLVEIQGPAGGFTLREEDKRPRVFLAGGIGITVFHSLMMDVVERDLQIPLTLFASFARQEDMIFLDELKKIENEQRRVIYIATQDDSWQGERGRVSENLLRKYAPSIENTIFMLAGSQEMVDDMNTMLLGMGVLSNDVRLDYFTGY